MAQINVDIPDEMSRQLTQILESGIYATQSEMIREALRNFIKTQCVTKTDDATLR